MCLFVCSNDSSLESPTEQPTTPLPTANEITIIPKANNVSSNDRPNLSVSHAPSQTSVKIRRYLNVLLFIIYFYTKPLIDLR